ncbi:MAG: PCRF domain-containing protein, partial [Lentisphaeria bacterium]
MHDFQKYIDSAQERSQEVEQELAHFDFNSPDTDQGQYEKLNREYQRLRNLLNTWNDLQKNSEDLAGNRDLMDSEEDPEFLEVVQTETQELEARTEKLDRKLKSLILPPLPMEDRNSIVEIRPAAGGDEAGLFAAELLRMYSHFAEERGWKQELLEQVENAVGGIKSVAFSLQGTDVHRYMKFESGVHRVQRIPETESGGRVHTSTVTVAVLPEAEEVDVQINPEDLKLDVFRSSGPGEQSV